MNILAIDLRLADLEHALGIEPYIAQRAIQRQDRSGGQRNRLRLYRRAQCAQRYAQEKESAGLRTNHQFEVQRHECLIKDATGGGCLSSRGRMLFRRFSETRKYVDYVMRRGQVSFQASTCPRERSNRTRAAHYGAK